MLLDPPVPGVVAEITQDKFGGTKGVVAVVEGDLDAVVSKSNEVPGSITSHIGDEPDVLIDAPPSHVVTEVFDRGEGLDSKAVTENNDTIEPKTHDIGITCARDGDWVMG